MTSLSEASEKTQVMVGVPAKIRANTCQILIKNVFATPVTLILSRVCVTVDGVWIGNWIY
jgi:hypothetical protein